MGCKCKISVEINSNVSKITQANSLLYNFQTKSCCYLVTLSLESSHFSNISEAICHFSAFGALIPLTSFYSRLKKPTIPATAVRFFTFMSNFLEGTSFLTSSAVKTNVT